MRPRNFLGILAGLGLCLVSWLGATASLAADLSETEALIRELERRVKTARLVGRAPREDADAASAGRACESDLKAMTRAVDALERRAEDGRAEAEALNGRFKKVESAKFEGCDPRTERELKRIAENAASLRDALSAGEKDADRLHACSLKSEKAFDARVKALESGKEADRDANLRIVAASRRADEMAELRRRFNEVSIKLGAGARRADRLRTIAESIASACSETGL